MRASVSDQQFADQNAGALRDERQTLLEIIESIASHRDLSELFHVLAQPLRNILHFDYLSVRLHDPERDVMRHQAAHHKALGVQTFREDRQNETEFMTISYWESVEAMSKFTGGDPRKVHHLEWDKEFLIELPKEVQILRLLKSHGVRDASLLPCPVYVYPPAGSACPGNH